MIEKILTMILLKDTYGVCRLDKNELIPAWAQKGEFFSITKTTDELSIVCHEGNIPDNINCEKDWKILKIEGQLDFSLIGILSSISSILANKGISIFAVSTYDTDYILIKNKDIENAVKSLIEERYEIIQ
ncbi:ACT domain-containing protein [Clostridium folliculivorans]|uniref:Amino acid-binding protein n=1 Tax=Clostridium folliculivorans TaxID=2886038 RepID=A0A9W5Y297_9CLOT|nr:ACT domain-containing protein [Clostridium folliculivorans]GKU25270.1 amino acid-binding protein [Clostridium folliculivorans]GKU28291.1 amino acid-binding protein [Clostridium folliculivorans]